MASKLTHMKKYVVLIGAFLLFSIQLLAQAPVYLTKSYNPVDSERYTAYPSLEIEGGDIWNNCFVLGVINNYHGRASFSLGSKYETISFIVGPGKSHGKHDPDVVQIHADGKRVFEHVVREADLAKHFTLNISGVDKLEFCLLNAQCDVAFCEVAL